MYNLNFKKMSRFNLNFRAVQWQWNSVSFSPSTELVFEEVNNFKDPPQKTESLQVEQ